MVKASWNDYSTTAASNTDINSINIDENCPAANLNNAIREVMKQTADVVAGTTALSSVNIDGGAIDGTVIGGTTPAAINGTTGVFSTSSSGDAVRITQTGTGNALVVEDSANPDSTPFVVDASGKVGIGTSSPGSKLEVTGNILINNGLAAGGGLLLASAGYSNWYWDNYSGNLRAIYGSSERMRIDSSGNVGIGTNSPSTPLHVVGTISIENSSGFAALEMGGSSGAFIDLKNPFSDDYDARLWTDGTDVYLSNKSATGSLDLKTNDTQRLRIDSSGNVGIGTSSPTTKLDVNGNVALPNATALQFKDGGGTRKDTLQLNSSSNVILQSPSASIFQINGTTEAMRITSGGYVGIGETSVSNPLHVKGGNNTLSTIIIDGTASGGGRKWGLRPGLSGVSNGYFAIYDETAAAARLTITDSGTVDVPGTLTATTFGTSSQNAYGARTVSTSSPTGGSDGDIWYTY